MTAAGESAVASATRVMGVAKRWSAAADRENRFPREAFEELQKSGLLGLMAAVDVGGGGGTFTLLANVAGILAQGCPSTAIIWAMHSQQVMTLAEHGRPG